MDFQNTNLQGGSLQISTEVIGKIARCAALEIDGVAEVSCGKQNKKLKDLLEASSIQSPVTVEDLNAENEIETLIRAKGFADCLCFLQSGRADLTVMTSGQPLTAAQVAQIRDVVLSKSSVTAQNITVVEVK